MSIDTQVVIVGAGPAGLAVASCLRQRGIPFVILERNAQVATSWRNHYERLHLHSTKRFSSLPYLPFPANAYAYPSREQVVSYLEAYAKHFELLPRFNQKVISVRRQNGRWQTQTEDCVYTSSIVVIATGLNESPTIPTWPGQEQFAGPIIHSSQYKNGQPYRNQRALVVGFGNSGAEIALDLYEHGASVGLSVRSPINVIFRDIFGFPMQFFAIALSKFPPRVIDEITKPLIRLAYGDLSPYGLQIALYGSAAQVLEQSKIPVIDKGTIELIKRRKILVYPGITHFTRDGVIFSDGTQYSVDAIVLATGYHVKLNTLVEAGMGVIDSKGLPVKSGRATTLEGLYFCGFKNSIGGLLRQIGIEAVQIATDIASK